MKPTLHTVEETSRSHHSRGPITDYSFHPIGISGYSAHCPGTAPASFRNTTLEYFKGEARYDFLIESGVFAAMMLTIASPLLNGIQAVLELIRATGGV
jgi:hypothetical protein